MTERPKPEPNKCFHCGIFVPKDQRKWWRWAGWSVYGTAPSAPARDLREERDLYDFLFHKQCFPEWLANRNGGLQELDRPVNNCLYFQRTGSSIHGYYVRDEKKHPCLAAWTEYDVLGTSVFHTVVTEFRLDLECLTVAVKDHAAFLRAFQEFLGKNGWLNEKWYEPRKPFAVLEDVAKKMRGR